MDTLTFSAPILFRHLTFSEAKKQPISEINLQAALDGLEMNMSQVHPLSDCFPSLLLTSVSSLTCAFYWVVTISNPSKALAQNQPSSSLKSTATLVLSSLTYERGKFLNVLNIHMLMLIDFTSMEAKRAAKARAEEDAEDEEVQQSEDEPAATSDIERPDVADDSDNDDDEKKPTASQETTPKKSKAKTKTKPKGKAAGKRAGGIVVPEEWPWEEAKQIFEHPDVLPADQVEVCFFIILSILNCILTIRLLAGMEEPGR